MRTSITVTDTAPTDEQRVRSQVASGLAAGLMLLGVLAALLLVPGHQAIVPLDVPVPLATFGVLFVVADRIRARLTVRGHVVDAGAAGVALVVGLAIVDAETLVVARLLAAVVDQWLLRRHSGPVLSINLGGLLLATALAVGVLEVLLVPGAGWDGRATLALTVAALVSAIVRAAVVLLVITVSSGTDRLGDLVVVGAVTAGSALAAGSVGVYAADLLLSRTAATWIAAVPAALVLATVAAIARQRASVRGLVDLVETTRVIHEMPDPTAAVERLLFEVRTRLGGDAAALVRRPADGSEATQVIDAGHGVDALAAFVGPLPEVDESVLLHGADAGSRWASAMATTIPTPTGDRITVRVSRTSPDRQDFGRADLQRFRELAAAAVTSLENSRMAEMLERMREVDEMKTAFLTAVSHDLRTPLAVVRAAVDTLLTHRERMQPEQLEMILGRMKAQGRRLDQMLLDLLDIDRLQRGVLYPMREPADVGYVAGHVIDGIAATSHPIQLEAQDAIGVVDTGQVSRMLENLIRNAIKYTPDGTPIWVRADRDALGVRLMVADAGPGVPDERKTDIFGAFVRGDDNHASPGTGVGLNLVRRLAELHGGRAWVDDRPGGGARFWVTLPDPPREEVFEGLDVTVQR